MALLTIGDQFRAYNLTAVIGGDLSKVDAQQPDDYFTTVSSDDYKGKWRVVFFWPKDFTFVCPTEIAAFGKLNDEFADRDTQVLGASVDNEFVHFQWRAQHEDLKTLPFPMLSDLKRELVEATGVLNADGVADRATFIVDPNNEVQFVSVTAGSVGRWLRHRPRVAATHGPVTGVIYLLLGGAAGYLRYDYSSRHDADAAGTESVQAARDSTIALLSYKPESVDKDLTAARDRLTGSFLDAYTQLVNTVVIPGAKEKKISAVAQVPAAASVSAKPDHAVVLAFVDQTVVVGNDAPTRTASSVRITLEKVGGRWLISGFEPV